MALQALYRRWRAQTFDEIVGQDHVVRTLQNALQAGRIAHAYLFSGPRGTGKTSTARILAKAVNCLAENPRARPDNTCAICEAVNEGRLLDLIEIDAASNRGIDEVRDLRDKVNYAPSEARYKVYVIDEVHMMTNEAFNALLKTLEEPPPHVIFVLATTDPQRVPATVLSRCQRFDFRRISQRDTVMQLGRILKSEGREAEPAALEEIARAATGSLRDAISLLDQLLASGTENITLGWVHSVLGLVAGEAVQRLAGHLMARETAQGLGLINQFAEEGADLRQFSRQVVGYLRGLLLLKIGDGENLLDLPAEQIAVMRRQMDHWPVGDLMRAVRLFNQAGNDLKLNFQAQLPLEMAFIEATLPTEMPTPAPRRAEETPARAPDNQTHAPTAQPVRTPQATPAQVRTQESAPAPKPVAMPASATPNGATDEVFLAQVRQQWQKVLAEVRKESSRTEAMLRSSRGPVSAEGTLVVIGFRYRLHVESVDEPKQKTLVEAALSRVLGKEVRARCQLLPEGEQPANQPDQRAQSNLTPLPPPEPPDAPMKQMLGQFAKERGGQVLTVPPEQGKA